MEDLRTDARTASLRASLKVRPHVPARLEPADLHSVHTAKRNLNSQRRKSIVSVRISHDLFGAISGQSYITLGSDELERHSGKVLPTEVKVTADVQATDAHPGLDFIYTGDLHTRLSPINQHDGTQEQPNASQKAAL